MIFRAAIAILILVSSQAVLAFEFEDDASVELIVPDKAQQRLYPGGRDEQELQVQASLPTPSRTLDGFTLVEAPSAEATPAAND